MVSIYCIIAGSRLYWCTSESEQKVLHHSAGSASGASHRFRIKKKEKEIQLQQYGSHQRRNGLCELVHITLRSLPSRSTSVNLSSVHCPES